MNKGQYACQRPRWTLASYSSSVGVSPPSSCGLANAHFCSLAGPSEFWGDKVSSDKADEAAGLSPSNEENAVRQHFGPQKPCCPLFINGINDLLPGAFLFKNISGITAYFPKSLPDILILICLCKVFHICWSSNLACTLSPIFFGFIPRQCDISGPVLWL